MKILIIGEKDHGKDEAGAILADLLGASYQSTSDYANERLMYPLLAKRFGYKTPAECHADRGRLRPLWYQTIADYCRDDLARVLRGIFEVHRIGVGARDRDEFTQAKTEGLFDHVLWIDASKRKPPELRSSMSLVPGHADTIIDNNGSIEELRANLKAWLNAVQTHSNEEKANSHER